MSVSEVLDMRGIERFYFDYASVIDDGDLERWPELFVETGTYRIISKENHDRGLPLCLMYCQGIGMLKDRAFASAKLNVYAPRTWRHMVSNIRAGEAGGRVASSANFAVFETVASHTTQVLACGRYLDVLVRTDAGIRLAERTVVYDAALIPGSVVFPI